MDRILQIRVAALYLPIVLALVAGRRRKQPRRQFAACLLSLLWTLPTLLALQSLNEHTHWWAYNTQGPHFRGMPLELYIGWSILWGIFPQLAFPRLPLWLTTLLMLALDLIAMPRMSPVMVLAPHWLIGEAVAIAFILIPALWIARATRDNLHLPLRAAFQLATAALIFLYLLPEIVFAAEPRYSWQPLLHIPAWQRQLWLQIILIAAIPGTSAVMEFALRGRGTPIPYDPPSRLVTSGIYRYLANPIQLSCALVMLLWAAMLRNPWLLLAAVLSLIYSAGIARWDEAADLSRRFGLPWLFYRVAVRNWRPRWRPYHAGPSAKLYIAATCGPCSEIRAWFERRQPCGMVFVDAENLPSNSIRRVRYDPGDGTPTVEGVRAIGRALEHLNLAWALAGATLRLPILWQFIQLTLDASGLGPRAIQPYLKPQSET